MADPLQAFLMESSQIHKDRPVNLLSPSSNGKHSREPHDGLIRTDSEDILPQNSSFHFAASNNDTDSFLLPARNNSPFNNKQPLHNQQHPMANESPSKAIRRKSMALKEQEKVIDEVKKENFDLKLLVYQLEEELSQRYPGHGEDLNLKVNLKAQLEQLKSEIDGYKRHAEDLSTRQQQVSFMDMNQSEIYRQDGDRNQLLRKIAELEPVVFELEMSKRRIEELESSAHPNAVLEKTVGDYRGQIEDLEQSLMKTKSQNLDQASTLSRHAVEIEKLRKENESLRIQMQANSSFHGSPDNRPIFNRSFSSSGMNASFFDPAAEAGHTHQLEQGINMMRDQISDLKMQLIDKRSAAEQLAHEISNKTQAHERTIKQMADNWKQEESKLNAIISELREQLSRAKNDQTKMTHEIDRMRSMKQNDETSMQIQIQNLESQLSARSAEVKKISSDYERASGKIRAAESTLEMKESHISNLNHQLDNKNSLLLDAERQMRQANDQLNSRIRQLTGEIGVLNSTIQDKDIQIRSLEEQINRQKKSLVAVEEQWAKQTKEVTAQQKEIRDQLEQQIHQFKTKAEQLSNSLADKERELRETNMKLELHSVGLEATNQIRERDIQDLRQRLGDRTKKLEESERQKIQLSHQITELKCVQKDASSVNDRLLATIANLEQKMRDGVDEYNRVLEKMKGKEGDIRDKIAKINDLQQQLASLETTAAEGKNFAEAIEDRYKEKLEERNKLLEQIDEKVSKAISEIFSYKQEPNSETPSSNFVAFMDSLLSKLQRFAEITKRFDQRAFSLQQRFSDELKTINRKLEKKMAQLEGFEKIVRDAAESQKNLKEALVAKQEELYEAKITVAKLNNEISIQKHQVTSVESSSSILTSADRARLAEAQSKIAELERQVKDRENGLRQERERIEDLQRAQRADQESYNNKISDLTQNLRVLTGELKQAQQHIAYLEKDPSAVSRRSKASSLHEVSEAALKNVNQKLKEEIDMLQLDLEREQNRTIEREQSLIRLKNEYRQIKKRLEKKEAMIEMALSKLELVGHRKDSMELALLHQFTDDVKRMMNGRSSEDDLQTKSLYTQRAQSSSTSRKRETRRDFDETDG